MARSIRKVTVSSLVLALVLLGTRSVAAQEPVQVTDDPIRIADFGLEAQVTSAIDLVGPASGSAGRYRDALVERLQCWIDGTESCSVADRNDPRVRAIRRFLGVGPKDRDGAITVLFPDDTRIDVKIERVADLDPDDWESRIYEPVVVTRSAQGPGLPSVPTRRDEFEGLSHEASPDVQASLERLRVRLEASDPADPEASDADTAGGPRALVQRPPQ